MPATTKKPIKIVPNTIKTIPKVPLSPISKSKSFQEKLNDIQNNIDINIDDIPEDLLDIWDELQEDITPKLISKNYKLWLTIFTPFILPGIINGMSGKPSVPQPVVTVQEPAPDPKQIVNFAQKYFAEHGLELCKSLTKTDLNNIKQDLINNWGKGPDAFSKAFQDSYPVSKARLENIYRSERHIAEYNGVLERAKIADHKYKQWRAVGDERSCDLCMSHDMETVPINEPFSNGEMTATGHPQCRCSMVTYSDEDYNEMKEDSAYLDDVVNTIKLNYNCPDSEKIGSGPGSCGGNKPNEKHEPEKPTNIATTKNKKIASFISNALQEDPRRMFHGYIPKKGKLLTTNDTGFWLDSEGKSYVHKKLVDIPEDKRNDLINVHSHAVQDKEQLIVNKKDVADFEGIESFSGGDFQMLQFNIKNGYGRKIAVIVAPDEYDYFEVPEKKLGEFIKIKDIANKFEAHSSSLEESRKFLMEISNKNGFIYIPAIKFEQKQDSAYLADAFEAIKLNYKCPKGTVDDTNACGLEGQESKQEATLTNLPLGKPDFSGVSIQISKDVGLTNEKYRQELGDNVVGALDAYRRTDYIGINSYLRNGNTKGQDINSIKDQIKLLDSAFIKKTSEPITTFRVLRGQDIINKYQPGSKIDEKAYVSTTISGGVGFFGADSENAISLQIEVPKGTPFVDMSKATTGVENELLLPRNGKLLVKEVKDVTQKLYNLDENGNMVPKDVTRKYARVEYIPENSKSDKPKIDILSSGPGSCGGNKPNEKHEPEKPIFDGVPQDLKLGNEFKSEKQAVSRNEFNFKTEKKQGMYDTVYKIRVIPKKIPTEWKNKKDTLDDKNIWYDPTYMKEIPFGNGKSTVVIPINPEIENQMKLPSGKEEGYLFRGMSYEEFEGIKKNGYIKTEAQYNFDFQGDMTFFSDEKSTAANYASGFAPWQYAPTIDKPAIMIKVKDPGNHEKGTTEGEIGIRGKISDELITEVYVGRPVSMVEGYFEIVDDKYNNNVYRGNASPYKSNVIWEIIPYNKQKQDSSYLEDVTNFIKLNYNCPDSEKIGSGPGSCGGSIPAADYQIGGSKTTKIGSNPTVQSLYVPKVNQQEATKYVKSILIGDADKLIPDMLTDKSKALITEQDITVDEWARSGGVGMTEANNSKRGVVVSYAQSDLQTDVALHELGHAIVKPPSYSEFSPISKLDMSKPMGERGENTVESMLWTALEKDVPQDSKNTWIDKTNSGEAFADAFKMYNSPRGHLVLKEAFPNAYDVMKNVLGESKWDINVSPETSTFIKGLVTNLDKSYKSAGNKPAWEKAYYTMFPDGKYTTKELSSYNKRIKLVDDIVKNELNSNIKRDSLYLADATEFIKLNYKCKAGTVDDSNKCGLEQNTTSLTDRYDDKNTSSDVIAGYVRNDNKLVNSILSGDYDLSEKDKNRGLEKIRLLDNIFKDKLLPEKEITYRGISKSNIKNLPDNWNKIGNVISPGTFLSTSRSRSEAEGFITGGSNDDSILIKLILPRNTNAINVSDFVPKTSAYAYSFDENEVLVDRNTEFKVVDYRIENSRNMGELHIATWEAIPDEQKQNTAYLADAFNTIKLNYKCKAGTVDDSNKCKLENSDVPETRTFHEENIKSKILSLNDSKYPKDAVFRSKSCYNMTKNVEIDILNNAHVKIISDNIDKLHYQCDNLKIPRLRGIVADKNTKAGLASMADGILAVTPDMFRNDPDSEVDLRLSRNQERLNYINNKINSLESLIQSDKEKWTKNNPSLVNSGMKFEESTFYKTGYPWPKEINEYKSEKNNIMARINDLNTKKTNALIYTWKPGMPDSEKPFGASEYFPFEQSPKLLLDHEFGHHIHQLYGVKNAKSYAEPPLEKKIDQIYKKSEKDGTLIVPSKYAASDHQEWFAESYSLYVNGRDDLVTPGLIDLFKKIGVKHDN